MSGVRPPVKVALAESVSELPREESGWAYEPKFDGHRLVVFRVGGRVQLQARSGRIVNAAFPDLAEAAQALDEGTVLDGEVVVWTEGRIDFAAVQQRAMSTPARAAELARTLPASYAAFDLLALRGEDLRTAPYTRRREALVALLAPLGPPLQAVPMTTERALAESWYEELRETGIEGLVIKRLDQAYRAGRRSWLKLRHSDTRDAVVVGYTGPAARPQALVLVLPDDDAPVLSSPLGPGVRASAAELLPAAEGVGELNAVGHGDVTYQRVGGRLVVEVRQQATRHRTVGVVRFR
ncbi:ATP-dependent DNA ligase [Streptomyces sp. KLOTTS4A1]|uniref:ATP-dependent DNA ligase n=1 Tax=Streptomyces sp. KLOTTS4A1 TaxID=3390996 RepID=UPI0039F519AB